MAMTSLRPPLLIVEGIEVVLINQANMNYLKKTCLNSIQFKPDATLSNRYLRNLEAVQRVF